MQQKISRELKDTREDARDPVGGDKKDIGSVACRTIPTSFLTATERGYFEV